ncbi:MAG TPA: MBL fold metallo-hydrolase [Actinomycetes bacterium]|nr:MBL fold metallo-hydrolase [Actinomycetes bacterium]
MLVAGFASAAFGTNVYLVAPAAGEQCVVVDPGIEVSEGVDELLAKYRLEPVAVLLTHGHLDHTFSVIPVGTARGLPAYIHGDDRDLLRDPMQGISSETAAMFGGRLTWVEPDDVRLITNEPLELAGLRIEIDHAPGHTPGSVMFRLPGAPDTAGQPLPGTNAPPSETLLSGDVLFAGSIGRTDLPGGSTDQMMRSLAEKVLPLSDDILVLPGHGSATTIGRERSTNPFLRQASLASPPQRGL